MQSHRSLVVQIALLALMFGVFAYLLNRSAPHAPLPGTAATSAVQSAASASADASTGTSTAVATSSAKRTESATSTAKKASITAVKSASPATSTVAKRVENPYSTPPVSFDTINVAARDALVNILCMPRGGGSLSPISGSGIIIDPRGVILTNAHVAQYVLLSESPRVDLACFVRTGSPAAVRWTPAVLYIPPVWIAAHASELKSPHPLGTGEHDYALLYIAGSPSGAALPENFPYLAPDVRAGIGFVSDTVLAASYPAEFLGNPSVNLYAAASVTTIKQLFTFSTTSIDAISVGGVIEAQSGSSGGALVNAWRRLIGVITTTSPGATTAERDLRAITLDYIDRDLRAQTGHSLSAILAGDPALESRDFMENAAPELIKRLLDALTR